MKIFQKWLINIKNSIFPDSTELNLSLGFDLADIAMILFFSQRAITYIFSSLFGVKGIYIFMIGILILYVTAVIKRWKEGDRLAAFTFITILLIMGTSIFFSILRHPELKFWIFGSEWNFVEQLFDPRKNLFALLVILLVKNFNKIFRNMYYISIFSFIYLVYQSILFKILGNWNAYYSFQSKSSVYNMSFGYEMFFAAIIILSVSMINRSIPLLVLGSIATGLSIYYGSRGVILLLLAFVVLILLYGTGLTWKINKQNVAIKSKRLKSFVVIASIVLLTVMVFLPSLSRFFQNDYFAQKADIIQETKLKKNEASSQTQKNNVPAKTGDEEESSQTHKNNVPAKTEDEDPSSRTLKAITDGEFLADNGRFKIWGLSLQAFLDNPIFGQGFYGDRLYVGSKYVWGYSHNIALEIMAQYGIFGLIGLILLLFLAFQQLNNSKSDIFSLVLIIFGTMCVKLLISDSYLIYSYFWAFLGILIKEYDLSQKTSVFSRLKETTLKNIRKYGFIFLIFLFLTPFSLFVHKDYQDQSFKTIQSKSPKILITTNGSPENLSEIQSLIQSKGYQAETFLSASMYANKSSKKDNNKSVDFSEMIVPNWSFQDGGYYYENPYIRSVDRQKANFKKTLKFFNKFDLSKPIAYLPPYNYNNSTIQYRSMNDYAFIQKNINANAASPYTKITYPDSLSLKAVSLKWDDQAQDDIMTYLERAKARNAIALIYIDIQHISFPQLDLFLDQVIDMGFESISFSNLYDESFVEAGENNQLGIKNYIENTYLYNTLIN